MLTPLTHAVIAAERALNRKHALRKAAGSDEEEETEDDEGDADKDWGGKKGEYYDDAGVDVDVRRLAPPSRCIHQPFVSHEPTTLTLA